MLIVTGVTRIAPEDAPAARSAMARVAELTRAENGCHTYAFYEDVAQPGRFRVYEEWRDRAALDAHLETAHIAAFRAEMADVTILSREIKTLAGCISGEL